MNQLTGDALQVWAATEIDQSWHAIHYWMSKSEHVYSEGGVVVNYRKIDNHHYWMAMRQEQRIKACVLALQQGVATLISELDLPPGVESPVKRAGYTTVESVVQAIRESTFIVRGVSEKRLQIIARAMVDKGVQRLPTQVMEWYDVFSDAI
jgi:hypothetical protein